MVARIKMFTRLNRKHKNITRSEVSESHSDPYATSKMELFAQIDE